MSTKSDNSAHAPNRVNLFATQRIIVQLNDKLTWNAYIVSISDVDMKSQMDATNGKGKQRDGAPRARILREVHPAEPPGK